MEHYDSPSYIPTYVPIRGPSRTPSVVTITLPNASATTDPSQTLSNKLSNFPYMVPSVEHSDYPISELLYVPIPSPSRSSIVIPSTLFL